MAAWNLGAVRNSILENLALNVGNESTTIGMNHLLIGRDYTVQGSPDLQQWEDLHQFTAPAGTNSWSTPKPDAKDYFYRLRWIP